MRTPFDGIYIGPETGAAPRWLIVLCHGLHADAEQLRQVAKVWGAMLPAAAFALPNAPLRRRSHWLGRYLSPRREWFSIRDTTPEVYERGVRDAAGFLNRCVDGELDRLGIAPDAYVLAGFSQGAMAALFTGLRRPVAPRAIVSFAGSLIAPDMLPGELANRAPILLVHGEDDEVVSPEASRSAARILGAMGVPIAESYRPGLAHTVDVTAMLQAGEFLRGQLS